ncbi:sulfatase family protein [Marinoscillum furvescens]|uniref:Arylsulfatase A-like enzyme n=1 Tax=Marinoscillum furvescens DSM 4134 TaxID=1122208 RepID=A0A3D9L2U8_MARFU|nr:arylsulfatase [Marinoscillum furvescens]RED96022.1 arylsulfatase A-like enzyme [Marinoscillum furvescens DSM 4134]
MRTLFLVLLTTCMATLLVAQNKPNVIVILADDIGTGDISYYQRLTGGKVVVETPNIDELASEGVVFTNAHSPAALCAPSRYAVMTGNATHRSYRPWGVWGAYERSPLEPTDLTLGKLMKSAGYRTGFLGKWHMGGDWKLKSNPNEIYRGPRYKPELDIDITKRIGGGPQQNGFDYSLTLPSGVQDVPYAVYENSQWMPLHANSEITYISQEKMDKLNVKLDKSEGLGDSHWDPHHIGPLLAGKAVAFIERNASKPFFMYYCSQAVHLPHTPPDSLNGKAISGATATKHMDMIVELDQQIAMMVAALKKQGIYDNTLFVFTSDNGGLMRKKTLETGHRPNSIYKGGKNQIFEGGHRVPLIVSWPKELSHGKTNTLVAGYDILATLAELTGQSTGAGQAMDAKSFLSVARQPEQSHTIHEHLIIQGGTSREVAYYEGDWKLVVQFDKKDQTDKTRTPKALYHLKKDIRESNNLLTTQPSRAEKMFTRFNELRQANQ